MSFKLPGFLYTTALSKFLPPPPSPFRTMAGRRLRTAVRDVLIKNKYPTDTRVVIAGLSNTYSGYITTYEEFEVQGHM